MGGRASVPEDRTAGTPPTPLHPKSRRATTLGIVEQSGPRHVVVLVLGDVGRSPRMQYHAMSLASHGVRVTLVGYSGERCISAVENSPRVTSHRFAPPLSGPWGRRLKRRAYLLFAAIKALALLARVMYELAWRAAKPDAILVQNPPSLPGLACVYLACLLRRCPMVLDWHNLGFTMFDRGPRHPLVWITRRAEAFFGRRASINMTVSHGMRIWITQNFGIREAYIVYDQPPEFFRAPTLSERHELFKKLAETSTDFADAVRAHNAAAANVNANANAHAHSASASSGAAAAIVVDEEGAADDAAAAAAAVGSTEMSLPGDDPPGEPLQVDDEVGPCPKKTRSGARHTMGGGGAEGEAQGEGGEERTPFTTRSIDGTVELRRDRPALLVSSTSWTPDEDFSVLLEALRRFDVRTASGASPSLPLVMVVVTGKGPEKAMYVERMKAARMSRVAICTAWLEPDDYPVLLGSADLGICLHTSTSGVDLPMKVVDMFGCGVPVCAVHFDCLQELVRDGYNGCVFKDSTQLALQLEALLDGFPRGGCELEGYRTNVKEVTRWRENWDEFAWPLFSKLGRLPPASKGAKGGEGGRRRGGGGGGGGSGGGGVWETGWSTAAVVEAVVVPAVALVILLVVVPSLPGRLEGWAVGAVANVAARWRG